MELVIIICMVQIAALWYAVYNYWSAVNNWKKISELRQDQIEGLRKHNSWLENRLKEEQKEALIAIQSIKNIND